MGYFIDVDQELERLDELYQARRLDSVTGLMNLAALAEVSKSYSQSYLSNGVDFTLLIIRNDTHQRIIKDFGEDFANRLLKKIGDTIVESSEGNGAVAKCLSSDFALLTNICDPSELDILKNNIQTELGKIKELDGNNITLKIRIASKLRSDEGITDENMYSAVLQEFM